MSHTNKLDILYLIVVFYSWFLSSLSKCLHMKQKVLYPEKHSTNTRLRFQPSLELMHDLHIRKLPSTHSWMFLDHREGHLICGIFKVPRGRKEIMNLTPCS